MNSQKQKKPSRWLLTLAFGAISLFIAFLFQHAVLGHPLTLLIQPVPLTVVFLYGGGIACATEAIVHRAHSEKRGMILSCFTIPLGLGSISLVLAGMHSFIVITCTVGVCILVYWALKAALRCGYKLTW